MNIVLPLRGLVISSLLLLCSVVSHAQLLTAAYETQLESWLGQGDLQFTNIFTKAPGNTGADFHAAADGKGATFTLMTVYGNGGLGTFNLPTQIVGGYNPQSWNSSWTTNETPNDADRTAFIFNLSYSVIQRQNLISQGYVYGSYNSGQTQTVNVGVSGPLFGTSGGDLGVESDWNFGSASNFSYGGTSYGQEIVYGGANYNDWDRFYVSDLEVYTFTAIPEPSTYAAILGFVTIGFVAIRRRRVAF